MSFILNLIWLFIGGIPLFLAYLGLGLIFCITILGIPFGLAAINVGVAVLWPFGKSVVPKPQANGGCVTTGLTILWLLTAGLMLALAHLISGVIMCITIVGIPLGLQNFKFMQLALLPYQYELR